jgi:hypothetical protein
MKASTWGVVGLVALGGHVMVAAAAGVGDVDPPAAIDEGRRRRRRGVSEQAAKA